MSRVSVVRTSQRIIDSKDIYDKIDGHVYITLCSGQIIRTSAVTEVKDAVGESRGTRDILYGFAEWLTDETSFKENGRMYVVRSGAIYDAVELFIYEAGI